MQSRHSIIQNLNVLNWNANGLKNKKNVFLAFLARHNIDIACVTETHLFNNEPFKISGYSTYREDRVHPIASGGVAIFISKRINHHHIYLPQLASIEAVGIKLMLRNNQEVRLISVYKPPNKRFYDQDLDLIFQDNFPTLVLGDLNCKNQTWGCRITNPNGKRLFQKATNLNVNISAPSQPTHYPWQIRFQPDILDIALHKNFTAPILQQVLSELDSDHLPVVISFFLKPEIASCPLRLITGKVDWDFFKEELDKAIVPLNTMNLYTKEGIECAVDQFTDCLKSTVRAAINKPFPCRPNDRHQPPLRILRLIKEKHKTRRQWMRQRLPHFKRRLNILSRLVKNELDQFKIEAYRNYLSEINPNDANMWQATKRILHTPTIIPTLTQNNIHFESDEKKCNVLADFYENSFKPNDIVDNETATEVANFFTQTFMTVELPFRPTSPSEIKDIINKLPLRKTPGSDLIPNVVLKNLTKIALTRLTSVLNACLALGHFPSSWKHAEVIVIHKPGKQANSPASYRPISLLSSISKVFEKIIQKRMFKFIENSSTLPNFQFGFRPLHGTTHQLLRLSELIVSGFEKKEFTAAAFLDVAQAFDKVWHDGLLYKLHLFGFPHYLTKLIQSFISERTFSVKINSSFSAIRKIEAGVPQGSILGPLLFNLFVADLPEPHNASLALYADDTAILSQHKNLNEAVELLQQATNEIVAWFKSWRIVLNSNKCQVKIFSLKKCFVPNSILINEVQIPWNPDDQAIKYLGVYLDKKLNWNFHVNTKLNQSYARLTKLFPLVNRRSSLKTASTLLIYKTIIRPLMTYACAVWGSSISDGKLKKIQILQNKILRISVNSPWYIRNTQLHRELGIDTISEFINKTSKKFLNTLENVPGAVHYNLGSTTINRRLRPRLPQDILPLNN